MVAFTSRSRANIRAIRKMETLRAVDKKWFQDRFADAGTSQRNVASILGIHHASLAQTMAGKRRAQLDEVIELARICGTNVDEVIRKLGFTDYRKPASLPVNYTMDERGFIFSARAHEEIERVGAPDDEEFDVARIEAPVTPFHNWKVFFRITDRIEPEAVGTLAVVQTDNEPGQWMVRYLMRASEPRRYDIKPWPEDGRFSRSVLVTAATPIVWLRG